MSEQDKNNVYDYLFYMGRKWTFEGAVVFWRGTRIHYSDFMKAKRGSL